MSFDMLWWVVVILCVGSALWEVEGKKRHHGHHHHHHHIPDEVEEYSTSTDGGDSPSHHHYTSDTTGGMLRCKTSRMTKSLKQLMGSQPSAPRQHAGQPTRVFTDAKCGTRLEVSENSQTSLLMNRNTKKAIRELQKASS